MTIKNEPIITVRKTKLLKFIISSNIIDFIEQSTFFFVSWGVPTIGDKKEIKTNFCL